MLGKRINQMIEDEKHWLRDQPGMNPWQYGCIRLSEQLDDWTAEYSEGFCEAAVTASRDGYPQYVKRLWQCWSHHWSQAAETSPIEGCQVARQIQSGRGYQRGGSLGGDPLHDVVLAVAMTEKENRAVECFQADYFDYAKNLSGKVNSRFRHDADDWWSEFLDLLAGYTKPPGKLHCFIGKCALRNWLGTVLWNFLRRRPLPEGAEVDEMLATTGENSLVSEEVAREECVGLFRVIIEAALAELKAEDRLILALLYIDRLKGKDAAAILGVHPGQITRRREAALRRLRELTEKHAAVKQQSESFQQCLELLPGSQADFAAALIEALKEVSIEESER